MTLILTLECADGVILASDSQATIGTNGQPLRGTVEKLYMPWSNVAWGGSGDTGVLQHVDHALRANHAHADCLTKKSAYEIREALCATVRNSVKTALSGLIQLPGHEIPTTGYLFTGIATDGPFIFEIGADLRDQDHEQAGYSAIGSGDIFPYFALASLAHFNVRQHTVSGANLIAYRIVEDACTAAASGLGLPVQLVEICRPDGANKAQLRQLSANDLKILADKVTEWKLLESETLESYIGVALRATEVTRVSEGRGGTETTSAPAVAVKTD